MIVTGPGDDAPTKGLAIFKGHFDPTKIHAKVKALIQSQADLGKILQEPDGKGGDFQIYQVWPGSPGSHFIALPDSTTLFLAEDKAVILEALKKAGSPGKADLKDKDILGGSGEPGRQAGDFGRGRRRGAGADDFARRARGDTRLDPKSRRVQRRRDAGRRRQGRGRGSCQVICRSPNALYHDRPERPAGRGRPWP